MPQIKGKQIADAQITQEKLNLVDPTSALEAATKQYVDNLADGKIDGTIAANEVAFGTGVDSIGGDANFTWDSGANTLALTSAGPALTVSNDVDGQFVSIEAGSHSMDFIDPLGSSAVALISAVNGFTAGDGGTNSTNITAGEVLVEQPGSSLSASVTPAVVTLVDNVQQISLSAIAAELSIKGDSALPTVPSIAAKDADNSATTLNLSVGGLTVNGASGDAGQVLTSQGAGVAPVWADASGGIAGTIGVNQIAFGSAADTIGGDSRLTWNELSEGEVKVSSATNSVKMRAEIWPLIEASDSMNINIANFNGALGLQAGGNDLVLIGGDDGGGQSYLQSQNGVRIEARGPLVVTDYDGSHTATLYAKDSTGTASPLNLSMSELQMNGASGDAGQVLTSNGAGVAPTWSALSIPDASITQAKLNLTTPSSPNDASTKQYVDDLVNGTAWKTAAFAVEATTSVDVIIGGVRYVDGVYCGVGTRVLLTAQSVPSQNGIWVIQAGSYTRPDDFADGSSAINAALFVSDGDNYADTQWVCTSSPAVVGTNNLSFIQFGASVSYTAGDGLDLAGNAFSVATSGITETMLADTSVTQAKLNLIDPTSALEAATKQYVDNSIGDIVLPPAGSVSKIYYVSTGGDDSTADGSISKPFLTLQAAHDQALLDYPLSGISTAEVQISVAPGTYIGNLSVTRQNTYFVAQPQSAESKSVVIQGTVSINCSTALYVYAEKVSFSGFLFSPVANTVACMLITGTGIFSSLFDNCYINSSSTNAAAHAIHCNNTAATRPIIRLTRCVIRAERNANNAIKGERGDWRVVMSSVENQAVPSVSTTSAAVFENDATLTAGYALFESANNAAVISCSGTMPGSTKASIAWSTIVNTCNVSASNGFSLATAGLAALISYSTFSITNTLSTTFAVTGVASSVIALPSCCYVVNTNVGGGFTLSAVTQDFAGGDLTGRYPVPTIRNLAVTTAKIAALAVDSTKLASNAVTTAKIADAQVTQAKLSLTSPSNASDAATKQYVDNLTLGLSWKDVVRLVATSPVTLSGVQTIDGLSTGDRDRVLLTAQGDPKDNGIYITSLTTNWARAEDLAAGSSAQGTAVLVAQGGTYADTQWICTTDAPNDIVAANNLSFTQFGVGTSYTAGNGLQLLGSAFSVLAENDSITVSASGIKAATLASSTQEVAPSDTTGNASSTGIALATKPLGSGVVHVFVNGLRASVGDASTAKEAYFSNDGGITPLAFSALDTGDILYWNGIVAGYDLANATDLVSFLYQD